MVVQFEEFCGRSPVAQSTSEKEDGFVFGIFPEILTEPIARGFLPICGLQNFIYETPTDRQNAPWLRLLQHVGTIAIW